MKLYITTLPNGFFGNAGQSWKTLDTQKISKLINIENEIIDIRRLIDMQLSPDDIVFYTSSDEPNIRAYIQDLMFFVNKKCLIIPSYEMLLAHENKGFQELYKSELGIGNLAGNYFFDLDDTNIQIPKVFKTVSGAGSSGVFLIEKEDDISRIQKNHFKLSAKRRLIKVQRQIKLKEPEFEIYSYRHKGFSRFVEQEFIPNLKYDFKVLVFGNRYFVLKRSVKKNDFRASGSGNFEFIEPPREVLDFSKQIANVLDTPYLSLDIAQSEIGCHLIEYQATNFGPYTLLNAPNRYVYEGNSWTKEKNDKDLESNYAYAFNYFMKKRV